MSTSVKRQEDGRKDAGAIWVVSGGWCGWGIRRARQSALRHVGAVVITQGRTTQRRKNFKGGETLMSTYEAPAAALRTF
jgi:hypothetical protein